MESIATFDDAWKRRPNVAVIAAPTSTHVPLALQAAKRGCHLFIEKPVSDRLEGLTELLDVVTNQGLVTLVGCNMRFHPGLMKVKRLLEEKASAEAAKHANPGGNGKRRCGQRGSASNGSSSRWPNSSRSGQPSAKLKNGRKRGPV